MEIAHKKESDKKSWFSRYVMGDGEKRKLPKKLAQVVKWVAILTTLYNMWAVFGYPEPILHRGISLGIFYGLVFMLYTMPAGLMIYWNVSNVWQIFQTLITNRQLDREEKKREAAGNTGPVVPPPPAPKPAPKKGGKPAK